MNEDQKKQIAVFRFGVIHEFVGGAMLDYGSRSDFWRRNAPANGKSLIRPGPGSAGGRY